MRVNKIGVLVFAILIVCSFLLANVCVAAEPDAFKKDSPDRASIEEHFLDRDGIGVMVNHDLPNQKNEQKVYNVFLLQNRAADDVIDDLKAKLVKENMPQKVVKCFRVINVPVGTAHGNNSYGAICRIEDSGEEKIALLCKDDFVGRLKIADNFNRNKNTQPPIDYSVRRGKVVFTVDTGMPQTYDLVKFVTSYCYGG